jgi:solute carrier family 25 S-adenosylmethionine transporter 26
MPSQIRSVLAKEGARGLYAGYGAFMLRDLPFDAIQFVVYEQVWCQMWAKGVRVT